MKKWFLLPFAALVWVPLWLLATAAVTGQRRTAADLGPALAGKGQAAWTLLPSWPTLQPILQLLLDTPEYFAAFWNTCAQCSRRWPAAGSRRAGGVGAVPLAVPRAAGAAGVVSDPDAAAVPGHDGGPPT